MTEEFLSFDNTLKELQLSEEELTRMVSEGKIKAYRSGDEIVFKWEDMEGIKEEQSFLRSLPKIPDKEEPQYEYQNENQNKESVAKKVATGAAIGAGCLGMGIVGLIIQAIPIVIAILIVIWILRSCAG